MTAPISDAMLLEYATYHKNEAQGLAAHGLFHTRSIEEMESLKDDIVQEMFLAKTFYERLSDCGLKAGNSKQLEEINSLKKYFLPGLDDKIAALKKLPTSPKDKGDSKVAAN